MDVILPRKKSNRVTDQQQTLLDPKENAVENQNEGAAATESNKESRDIEIQGSRQPENQTFEITAVNFEKTKRKVRSKNTSPVKNRLRLHSLSNQRQNEGPVASEAKFTMSNKDFEGSLHPKNNPISI